MFSLKDKSGSNARTKVDRNRNIEAIVRNTHEYMVRKEGEAKEFPSKIERQTNSSSEINRDWDDIVFENRNQDYGAYVLRKGYVNNLTIGLIITIILVIILIIYPILVKFFDGVEHIEKAPPRKLVYTELSAPPPIDRPKPPPPKIQLPRLLKLIKFVPPKVVKEDVIEVAPTIEEIKENNIGAADVEEPTEVIFDEPVPEVVIEDDNELFTVVDQQPEFEGGYEAMMAFIQQNMKYPPKARRMQIDGTVHVSFIVSKTGSISEVKVLRGIMTECDNEAIRVIQLMPTWRPGKQNGRNVNVRFILPLKFRLN